MQKGKKKQQTKGIGAPWSCTRAYEIAKKQTPKKDVTLDTTLYDAGMQLPGQRHAYADRVTAQMREEYNLCLDEPLPEEQDDTIETVRKVMCTKAKPCV